MNRLSFVSIVNGRPTLALGFLRNAITIQQQTPSMTPIYDAAGVVADSWTTFTTALAAIAATHGTDVIKGGQQATQLLLTVAMWWQAGVIANMRIITDSGSVYVIQSVENVLEMNIVLVLDCLALGSLNE